MTAGRLRRIHAVVAAAAALLAALPMARAADCCQWELRVQRTGVASDNFLVELYAHIPESGHAFFDGGLDIKADGVMWRSTEICGDGLVGDAGEVVGSEVRGIYVAHDRGGAPPDRSNPIRVWCGEFEARCEDPATRQIWTEGRQFSYYLSYPGLDLEACEPRDSLREFQCGPIVIDAGRVLSPFPGTGHVVKGEGVELYPESAGARFGARLADELLDWRGGGGGGSAAFDLELSLAGLEPGAAIDTSWLTQLRRCDAEHGSLLVRMSLEGGDVVALWPDFSEAGIGVVLTELHLKGKLVGETEIKSGGVVALHGLCTELTWSLELDDRDRPTLALMCEQPFILVDPGGGQHQIDRLAMTGIAEPGGLLGMDYVEVAASEARRLAILHAGGRASACYADCDGSGARDFFDFLCFQNAFSAGNRYADCNEDGALDFFDFLCFQNQFAAACP